jgi:hypothetical protein
MTPRHLLPICAAVVCVDVTIDRSAYLDCLNAMFRQAVMPQRPDAAAGAASASPAPANPAPANPALANPALANPAASPAPALGTYNQAAIREMLGTSFGHSVEPARPASPNPAPPRPVSPLR